MIRSLLLAGFGCILLASCAPGTVISRCDEGAFRHGGCLGAGSGDTNGGIARRAEPTRVAERPASRPGPAPGSDPVGPDPVGPGGGGAAPAGDGGSGVGGDPGTPEAGPTDGPGGGEPSGG
ncbi:MAG: hypothetical protein AB7X49_13860 [Geminicoccaceae bacterium]